MPPCHVETAADSGGYFFDGNDLKKFTLIMKISYVSGLYDGGAFCEMNLRANACSGDVTIAQRFPMDLPFKDVVAAGVCNDV